MIQKVSELWNVTSLKKGQFIPQIFKQAPAINLKLWWGGLHLFMQSVAKILGKSHVHVSISKFGGFCLFICLLVCVIIGECVLLSS